MVDRSPFVNLKSSFPLFYYTLTSINSLEVVNEGGMITVLMILMYSKTELFDVKIHQKRLNSSKGQVLKFMT